MPIEKQENLFLSFDRCRITMRNHIFITKTLCIRFFLGIQHFMHYCNNNVDESSVVTVFHLLCPSNSEHSNVMSNFNESAPVFIHDFYSFTQVLVNWLFCLHTYFHSWTQMSSDMSLKKIIFLTQKFHSPQLQWEAKAMPSLSCRAPLLMHILQRWIPNVSTSAFFFFFDLYMGILLTAATYVNVCLCRKGIHTFVGAVTATWTWKLSYFSEDPVGSLEWVW